MKYFSDLLFPFLSTLPKTMLCVSLLSMAGSCDALFGDLSTPNPANCGAVPESCQADEVCQPQRQVCVPALALYRATPNLGSSKGGSTVSLFGDRFLPGISVELDGQLVPNVTYKSPTEISFILPESIQGHFIAPVVVRNPTGHSARQDSLFRYYAEQLSWNVTADRTRLSSPVNTVLAGDFTNDGRADLLFGSAAETSLQLFPTAPDGQLQTAIVSSAATNPDRPTTLYPFTLPTDSQPGVLLLWGKQVQRFSSDGLGHFTGHGRVGMGTYLSKLTVCKTDRTDARLVVAVDSLTKEVYAVALRLDGTFEAPVRIAQSTNVEALDCKDLDGDGKDELLTSDGNDKLTIWNVSQPGGITQKQISTTGTCAQIDLATADLDQDGDVDAVLSCTTGILPLRNEQGSLVIGPLIPNPTALGSGLVATDLSGDGWPDIIYVDRGSRQLRAIQSDRQGGYLSPVTVYSDAAQTWLGNQLLSVGDLNSDAKPDIVYASLSSGTIFAVAMNQSK